MAKRGTKSSEIEETTLHKDSSSAVPNKSPWKRKGTQKKKKKVITTRGIRSRSPSQVLTPRNRA